MIKHPTNRAERFRVRALKEQHVQTAKQIKEERASKVWRKLTKEALKEWETRNEFRETVLSNEVPKGI